MVDWEQRYNKNWNKGSWDGVINSRRQFVDDCCEICGKQIVRERDIDIHHVEQGRKGWKAQNEWGNVIVICKSCHSKIHRN